MHPVPRPQEVLSAVPRHRGLLDRVIRTGDSTVKEFQPGVPATKCIETEAQRLGRTHDARALWPGSSG